MKKYLLIILFVWIWLGVKAGVRDVRVFGEVITVTNTKVIGYITWGKNNLYWVNLFTASKVDNPYASYLKEKDGIEFKNGTRRTPKIHEFSCRFGDIQSLRPIAINRVELEIKSGEMIELYVGGSYDIGGAIYVEKEDGKIEKVPWELISEVRFQSAPSNFPSPSDTPITGIVTTPYGKFKGMVEWNRSANSLQNMLFGIIGENSASMAFRNIRSIRKKRESCVIALKSGREIGMWGSSDVDYRNNGVVIDMGSIGRVNVEWADFTSFEAVALEDIKQLGYDDFPKPKRLSGQIESRDKRLTEGILVYDLDEAMDFELLEGRNGNIVYFLPFRYLQKIEPKNYEYSWVKLKNGTQLVLGKYRDVNAENDGVLLFRKDREPEYFRWQVIRKIVFD